MAAFTSIASAIALTAAAAGSAHQVQQGRQAKRESESDARKAMRAQDKLQNDQRLEMEQMEAKKKGIAERALSRARQRMMGMQGRRSTIQTGALGLQGNAPTEAKGILGG